MKTAKLLIIIFVSLAVLAVIIGGFIVYSTAYKAHPELAESMRRSEALEEVFSL